MISKRLKLSKRAGIKAMSLSKRAEKEGDKKQNQESLDLRKIFPPGIFGSMGGEEGVAVPWHVILYRANAITAQIPSYQHPKDTTLNKINKNYSQFAIYDQVFVKYVTLEMFWPKNYDIQTKLETKVAGSDSMSAFLKENKDWVEVRMKMSTDKTPHTKHLPPLEDNIEEIIQVIQEINFKANKEEKERPKQNMLDVLFPNYILQGWAVERKPSYGGRPMIVAYCTQASMVIEENEDDSLLYSLTYGGNPVEQEVIRLDDTESIDKLKEWIQRMGEKSQEDQLAKQAGLIKIPKNIERLFQHLISTLYAKLVTRKLEEAIRDTNTPHETISFIDYNIKRFMEVKEKAAQHSKGPAMEEYPGEEVPTFAYVATLGEHDLKDLGLSDQEIEITLFVRVVEDENAGIYHHSTDEFHPAISANIEPEYLEIKNILEYYEWNANMLKSTMSHELRHLIQFESFEDKYIGLPSPRIQSRDYDIHGIHKQQLSFPGMEQEQPHPLRDIEFHARLGDEVMYFKYFNFRPEQRIHALKAWVGIIDYVDFGGSPGRVNNSEFFKALKDHAPGKWREAVKQFYKAVI
jgi:hypothetical protein